MEYSKIRREDKSFVKPKFFVRKIDINKQLTLSFSDNIFFVNKLKNFVYVFFKDCYYSSTCDYIVGKGLQMNGFYLSLIEDNRNERILLLRRRVSLFSNLKIVRFFFRHSLCFDSVIRKRKNVVNLGKGCDVFNNFYADYLNVVNKRYSFLKILKAKRFFGRIFFSRVFLYAASGKKGYKSPFFYFQKRNRKIHSLFHVYTLASLKYTDLKKQRKKSLKKLAWKVKKQKKWRRQSWRHDFFRLRQRLSQVFYTPRHLEINYKTLALCYLGYFDTKTIYTKIGFWLNIRRLLTFLT